MRSKRILYFFSATCCFLCIASITFAQRKDIIPLPSDERLQAINDSIINEGMLLYNYEKASWEISDKFIAECKHQDKLTGVLTYAKSDNTITTIYYNENESKCYYEGIRSADGTVKGIAEVRDLTEPETEQIRKKKSYTEKAFATKIIKGAANGHGPLNIEIIPINKNLVRVYFLQGTTQSNILPIGNDYCFDFNAEGELISQRQCHKTFIPTPVNPIKPGISIHNHVPGKSYIEPSDICTFMLYGHDLYHMKEFCVFSLDFDRVFKFNAETKTIDVIDMNNRKR